MATLYKSEANMNIFANTPQEIGFQTSETSIPNENYNSISNLGDLIYNGGMKGVAILLNDTSGYQYLYGNRNSIVLPSEIGTSISGKLVLIQQVYHPNV